MISDEEEDDSSHDATQEGQEPGGCRQSLLVGSDSEEELSLYIQSGLSHNKKVSETTEDKSKNKSVCDVDAVEYSEEQEHPYLSKNVDDSTVESLLTGVEQLSCINSVECSAEDNFNVSKIEEEYVYEDVEIDYVHTQEWRNKKKHVFILSKAGKPIYSRYGKEDKLVNDMSVMYTVASTVSISNDILRCIIAGSHKFVFLDRDQLLLVAVASTTESMHQIQIQLNYIYNQILSVLTHKQLCKIFECKPGYDLRTLLGGAEKFIDRLLNVMEKDPSFLLGSIRCLPLDSSIRDTIVQTIIQHTKVPELVFAILLAKDQLISLVRMKQIFLNPVDLHLIFNLVNASESFKDAQSWTPVCLPKFNNKGYLYAHIAYLDAASEICLLLITNKDDMFHTLSECHYKIKQRLVKYKTLPAISNSLHHDYDINDVAISELRHFLYKSRSSAQYTSPKYIAPYDTIEDQDRLFSLYQFIHRRIHSSSNPLKIFFHVGQNETLLGWVNAGFELIAVFGPLITKPIAINAINKLFKWIKKEEDRLFIRNSPTF